MNPFDPAFTSDLFVPTRRELGRQSAARKLSARHQAELERNGPADHSDAAVRARRATAAVQKRAIGALR